MSSIEEFVGHKLIEDSEKLYYSIRGNFINMKDIASIVPEYHNNKRSLYMKIINKLGGKNIVKMQNKNEYNYIIRLFNSKLNTDFEEI